MEKKALLLQADLMRKRRAFPNGKPLPRRAAGRLFARALQNIVATHAIGAMNTYDSRITALAAELHEHPSYVRRVVEGAVGVSPAQAWRIGWALRATGIEWMSGPLALTVEPEYEGHLLGVIGEVLRPGPTEEIRTNWKRLRALSDRSWSGYNAIWMRIAGTPHKESSALMLPTSYVGNRPRTANDEPVSEQQARSFLKIGEDLTRAFNKAWNRWWDRENSPRLAEPVESVIEALRLGANDRVVQMLRADLDGWFEAVPHEWDQYGDYMRRKPLQFKSLGSAK